MKRHQRTLVALSGTATDEALVRYARLLASLGFARHYHFVHVLAPTVLAASTTVEGRMREHCQRLADECFGKPRPDVSSSCHLLSGVRVDQLIEFITVNSCDLVLLGHRRERSGQRSLARRLAMIAPASVLMLPEGAEVALSRIMAPADFSDHSADSVGFAACIARAAGLRELVVTHVYSDPSVIRYDEHADEIRRNELSAFERFAAPLERHGVELRPVFVEGNDVARTILHAARQQASDLLVMSTRGRSRAASILLGSVTTQVMIESPIAVLAVKHFGAMMGLFQALKESQFWAQSDPKTN